MGAMCKLDVPPVKQAIQDGDHTEATALAEEIAYEVSINGRFVPVQLCDCDAQSGCSKS